MCWTKKKPLGNSEKMAGAVRPLVLPLPEVEAEAMGWTKRNTPRPLRAAVTYSNAKGILVLRQCKEMPAVSLQVTNQD